MPTYKYRNIQNPNISLNPLNPFIRLSIINPNSTISENGQFDAILDTGSPITCIPEDIIDSIDNLDYSIRKFCSPINPQEIVKKRIYRLCLHLPLENINTSEIEIISIAKDYGIIGRDILNQYKIILNPPLGWAFNCQEICET